MTQYFLFDSYDKMFYDISRLVSPILEDRATAVIVGAKPRHSLDLISITPSHSPFRFLENEHFNLIGAPESYGKDQICLRDTSLVFGVNVVRNGKVLQVDRRSGLVLVPNDYILPCVFSERLSELHVSPFVFKSFD